MPNGNKFGILPPDFVISGYVLKGLVHFLVDKNSSELEYYYFLTNMPDMVCLWLISCKSWLKIGGELVTGGKINSSVYERIIYIISYLNQNKDSSF